MAEKWTPPEELIAEFHAAMLRELKAGGCLSRRIAADRAFVALKQPGMPWAGQPYGPTIGQTIMKVFGDEQNAAIDVFFPTKTKLPRGQKEAPRGLDRISKDTEFRERFLNRLAEFPGRPALAVEFDMTLEMITPAIGRAIEAELPTIDWRGFGWGQNAKMRSYVKQLAGKREEWAPLAELDVIKGVRVPGWTRVVTQQEKDVHQRLQVEADKKAGKMIQADDVLVNGSLSGAPGSDGQFSQTTAANHIGPAGRVQGGR